MLSDADAGSPSRTLIIQQIAAARDGDPTAISALYQANVDRIYAYIYHRVNDRQTAEDLTEDVFLKMLEALPECRAQTMESFIAWLFQIARRRVINYYRQHRRLDELTATMTAESDPVAEADRALTAAAVRRALKTLTDEQQDVLVLKFLEGFSNAEIAQILEKSEGSVKSLQHRALVALRQSLRGR